MLGEKSGIGNMLDEQLSVTKIFQRVESDQESSAIGRLKKNKGLRIDH